MHHAQAARRAKAQPRNVKFQSQALSISHFGDESLGHLNQMLLLFSELSQNFVVSGNLQTDNYFGNRKKVPFDEITGFDTVTMFQNTAGAEPARFTATYTVSLLQFDRSDEREKQTPFTI